VGSPLARNFGAGDENSTKDMGKFIKALDEIRAAYKCAIVVVHHTGHTQKDRGRGSTAMPGAVDMDWRVQKEQNSDLITLDNPKMKDRAKTPPMTFKLIPVDIGENSKGKMITSCILQDTDYKPKQQKKINSDYQDQFMKVLDTLYQDSIHEMENQGRDISEAKVSIKEHKKALKVDNGGMSRQTYKNNKESLDSEGWIEIINSNWMIPKFPEKE
jgi:RecA-family ATPase